MARRNTLDSVVGLGLVGGIAQIGLNLVTENGDLGRAFTRTKQQWGSLFHGFGRAGAGALNDAVGNTAGGTANAAGSQQQPAQRRRQYGHNPVNLGDVDSRAGGFAWDQDSGIVYDANPPHTGIGTTPAPGNVNDAISIARNWYARYG